MPHENELVLSDTSMPRQDVTALQIIWKDRIKIGRILFPDEKHINTLIEKVEQKFGLEKLGIKRERLKNRGPALKIKCLKKGCTGDMWPKSPTKLEYDNGARIQFYCVKCGHVVISKVSPQEWMKKARMDTLTVSKTKEMIQPAMKFKEKIALFKNTVSGPTVIGNVYEHRKAICGIQQSKPKQCQYLRTKVFGKLYWCGACGCGYNPAAELHIKLRFARLECPKIPSAFKAIDEKAERHLIKS